MPPSSTAGPPELYVDEGNQIRFLPFGLALPHRLNELILALRARLEAERDPVQKQLQTTRVDFPTQAATAAQEFYRGLTGTITDDAIGAATLFSVENETRSVELEKLLTGSTAEAADRRALAGWLDEIIGVYTAQASSLGEDGIKKILLLRGDMVEARNAADLAAAGAFAGEPLQGIGNDTWRRMWEAAREYSMQEAYPGLPFPVALPVPAHADPKCVLCHQPLAALARDRLQRFEAFVTGSLAVKADAAAQDYGAAAELILRLDTKDAKDTPSRLQQVKERVPALAVLLVECAEALRKRLAVALQVLSGETEISALPAAPIIPELEVKSASAVLRAGAAQIEGAALDAVARAKLEAERAELKDRRLLSTSIATLKNRRDVLSQDALYEAAIAKTQTQGITKRANDLIDKHLTTMVKKTFAGECKGLDIGHLNIGLARESKRNEAVFKTVTGTTLTRTSSDILSEGEQRAVALAGFLTETGIMAPDGPIIIDDPVSSLDRERCSLVAKRIVIAAASRQVIVFKHDLYFYNELCGLADDAKLEPHTCRIFRNTNGTGLLDPSGGEWMGMRVNKRLGLLKNDMARVSKLHNTAPSRYGYEAKNIYGRLRDAYERTVEEYLFKDTVSRFGNVVKTQNLRYVGLPHDYAIRFHAGMTKANTFSHDNPPAGATITPEPEEILQDIAALETLIEDFKKLHVENEKARAPMKP